MPEPHGTVSLRPATAENRAALESLRMKPGQEEFINSVADAFLEAAEEPGGRAIQFGLYDDETLVGFDEVDLTREFREDAVVLPQPTEEEISGALRRMRRSA